MTLIGTWTEVVVFNVTAKFLLVKLWHFVKMSAGRIFNLVPVIQIFKLAVFVNPLSFVTVEVSWFIMPKLSV